MYPEEENFYYAVLTGAAVLAAFVLAFVMIVLHYHKEKIALHTTRVKSEINALEKERARIAGDLHDDLGASLGAIKLKLQCLSLDDQRERALILASENYIDEAMLKLKRISFNMMPRVLERKGLQQALSELLDTIEQTTSVQINFNYDWPELTSEARVHIYRIVQESLNNIIKHSGATAASIQCTQEGKYIMLCITDNGKGFHKQHVLNNAAGQGLQNIMGRADVLNAKVSLTTAPGCGVQYFIQIPGAI